MRFFTLLLDPDGRGISDDVLRSYEAMPRRRGLEFGWQRFDHAAVLTAWDDPYGDPLVARDGAWIGVGMVRLDNRPDLERWAECKGEELTDLGLVLRVVARYGTKYIPQILGDFAFVVWDARSHTAVAACDAFAVKKLYYAKVTGCLAFASRAESLALDSHYDVQFFAELVAGCVTSRELSPYAEVRQLPAATLAVGRDRKLTSHAYWSPLEFEPDTRWISKDKEAAERCRSLLVESVRLRCGSSGTTWAQLSGGLDSSSVVSVAQWLAAQGNGEGGLSGTVTYVDRQGTDSDERMYSEAVVRRWPVRNEVILDPPFLLDGDTVPPLTDRPRDSIAFHPRERRLLRIVRDANGRVLLSGFGGDELFTGTMLFFADWIAQGRLGDAVREMVRRAAMGRASFWELSYRNVLLPFLPGPIQGFLLHRQGDIAPWMVSNAVRRYGLEKRASLAISYKGRFGHKYQHALLTSVAAASQNADAGFLEDVLDVRYPFLHRSLVEFALRLPPELCARPQARKWVLREAMRGILPELVRNRIGKGTPIERLAWSLASQRTLLAPLLRNSILADLGLVDPKTLHVAFNDAPSRPHHGDQLNHLVQSTLFIEAWLQLRSGRWPPRNCLSSEGEVSAM